MENLASCIFLCFVLFQTCLSDLQEDFMAAEKDLKVAKKETKRHYGYDDETISKLIDRLTSSIGKKDAVDYQINQLYDEMTEESDEACRDHYANCASLMPAKYCIPRADKMMKLCPHTCGFCHKPKLPKCATTEHGCCWDRKTAKVSDIGENCRPCNNDYPTLCKTFEEDCEAIRMRGDFMRFHCPQSCNLCGNPCKNYGSKTYLCEFWKSLSWCEKRKDVMNFYCKKTCGYC